MDNIIDINSFRKGELAAKRTADKLTCQLAERINHHKVGIILTALSELMGDVIVSGLPLNKREYAMEQSFSYVKRKVDDGLSNIS